MKRTSNLTRSGAFSRIQRRRLVDDVHERLRAAILERRFEPGERLDIRALAELFDVSQMPVRLAIGRLADAGLVRIVPRSGTFVAEIDPREIAETFDVRCALERMAGETAAAMLSESDIDALDELTEGMQSTIGDEDGRRRHDELNTEFHRRIVRAASNSKLFAIYEELAAHIKIARVHSAHAEWRSRVAREQTEHREIVAALRRRDGQAAGDLLARHIRRAKGALMADLESRRDAPAAD